MAQEVNFESMKIETGPRINKFNFSEQEKSVRKRIFFNPKVWKEQTHFKEGFGYFICLASTGKCPGCESGQAAGIKTQTRYGQHVVVYITDPSGRPKTPFGYDIQALIKTEKSYAKIYGLYEQYKADMFKHDFVVSCDNTQYQNLSFNIDLTCLWMQQANKKEIMEDIKKQVADFDLSKIIAPDISLDTMQNLVDGKIPNRYATKNTPAAGDPAMEFPPSGSAPFAQTLVKPSATANDLELLEQLSK